LTVMGKYGSNNNSSKALWLVARRRGRTGSTANVFVALLALLALAFAMLLKDTAERSPLAKNNAIGVKLKNQEQIRQPPPPLTSPPALSCKEDENDFPIRAPSLIIVGGVKCGSSAFRDAFERFVARRYVVPPLRDESGFFQSHRLGEIKALREEPAGTRPRSILEDYTDAEACQLRERYLEETYDAAAIESATKTRSQVLVYERCGGCGRVPGVAPMVHRLFSADAGFRVMAVLRDPVTRLHWEYMFQARNSGGKDGKKVCLPGTFDELVQNDVRMLRSVGLSNAPTLQEYRELVANGTVTIGTREDEALFMLPDLSHEDEVRRRQDLINVVIPTGRPGGEKKNCNRNMVYHSMYSLQLPEWTSYFENGKNFMVVNYDDLRADKRRGFRDAFRFLDLPPELVDELDDATLDGFFQDPPPVSDPGIAMSKGTEEYLRKLYRPYNERLTDVLGEEWRNAWGWTDRQVGSTRPNHE